jgi:hypothetical protein
MEQKMKAVKDFFTPKRVAVLKSYFRGVLVSALLASIAGPAAKALDKQETEFGVGSEK